MTAPRSPLSPNTVYARLYAIVRRHPGSTTTTILNRLKLHGRSRQNGRMLLLTLARHGFVTWEPAVDGVASVWWVVEDDELEDDELEDGGAGG